MPSTFQSPSPALNPAAAPATLPSAALGASFERYVQGQRIAQITLLALFVMLVLLACALAWQHGSSAARQRQLQTALAEIHELRSRVENVDAALHTYRGTGNASLLRSALPCAGQCLATDALAAAAGAALAMDSADLAAPTVAQAPAGATIPALVPLVGRVAHWGRMLDSLLERLGRGDELPPAQARELVDEALERVGRQMRLNLQRAEGELLLALAEAEQRRSRDQLLQHLLLVVLALGALAVLAYTWRRAARIAAAGQDVEQALRDLSLRDPLTGLPNQRALVLRLEHMIERADRHGGGPAVLVVDLHGFRLINEVHGHAAGDAALVALAQRLLAVLRKSDLPARVAGDEFVVLLDDPESPDVARAVGERLLLALRAPVHLPAPIRPVELSASVGLAHFPASGRSAQALLAAARAACAAAKLAGPHCLFESQVEAQVGAPVAATRAAGGSTAGGSTAGARSGVPSFGSAGVPSTPGAETSAVQAVSARLGPAVEGAPRLA